MKTFRIALPWMLCVALACPFSATGQPVPPPGGAKTKASSPEAVATTGPAQGALGTPASQPGYGKVSGKGSGEGYGKTVRVKVQVQMDIAWDPQRLPFTDAGLKSLADWYSKRFGESRPRLSGALGSLLKAWIDRTEPSEAPVSSTKPAGKPAKAAQQAAAKPASGHAQAGWHHATFTAEYELQPTGLAGQVELDTWQYLDVAIRDELQRIVLRGLNQMLAEWDRQFGHSKRIYDDIYERQKQARQELAEMKPAERVRDLQRQLDGMEIDERFNDARLAAVSEKVIQIRREAQAKAGDDPIAAELEKLVKLRQESLKLINAEASVGKATSAEVTEAEAKALEAQLQLAQRREAVAASVGGDLLSRLINDQTMLSIDCAVMRAKVGLLERKLMETRQRLEDLNHMAEDADKEMIAARPWVIVPAPDLQARPATSESH